MTAKYRIRVRGLVDKSWSDYFGALSITVQEEEDQLPTTTLCGEVTDQSMLVGILYRLYGLGFELLSLERIPAILAILVGVALFSTVVGNALSWSST